MTPIRILQVFTVLNRGGAETNVMNYYRNMDRTKIQFDFLVHRNEGAYEKEIHDMGGRIFRLPPIHPAKLKSYKIAVKKFFDENPDYHIVHGQLSELGVFIYEEAKRRGIPVIIAHAHNSPKLKDYDSKFMIREVWKRRMRKSVNARFTCGNDAAKWLFGKKMANDVFLMTNAVDSEKFAYNPEKAREMRKKFDAENSINFVNIGRFNKQKNHLFLLDVFKELTKLKPNARLYLVGDGDLKEKILEKIKKLALQNHVFLLGIREDIEDLLQAMDVFLFPSLYEGLGVAFIEAQTSGIKCVVSNGIPREAILVDDNVKVIHLKDNPKKWAQKITEIEISQRKNASDIIKKKGYDIKENASILEKKYFELLKVFS